MTDQLPLSGLLGALVRHGHREVAVRLIMERGGTKVYIPAHPRPGMTLVDIVGMPAAQVMADERGGQHYDIPPRQVLGKLDLKARILLEGGSDKETALKLGTTMRHVRRVRRDCAARPSPLHPTSSPRKEP